MLIIQLVSKVAWIVATAAVDCCSGRGSIGVVGLVIGQNNLLVNVYPCSFATSSRVTTRSAQLTVELLDYGNYEGCIWVLYFEIQVLDARVLDMLCVGHSMYLYVGVELSALP